MQRNNAAKFILSVIALVGAYATPTFAQHQHMPVTPQPTIPKQNLVTTAGFAPDGSLWLINQNQQGQLRVLKSRDAGLNWEPEQILDLGEDKPGLSGESPAQLAFGAQQQVLIAYQQSLGKRFTAELRLIRSRDAGRNFSQPVTVHSDRQIISHSFPVMRFDGQGVLHLAWLDGRDKAQVIAQEGVNEKGKSSYRGSALYRVYSRDGGASFSADTKLADHSCECCRIAQTLDQQGNWVLMWRHVFTPNVRDHAFARVTPEMPELAEPTRATLDNWKVDACPHHGAALAPASQAGFHAVWFGARGEEFALRYGRLDAQGRPAGDVRALPDAAAEHADLQTQGRRLVIIWRSFDGEATRVQAWISEDEGQHFTLRELARTQEENDYPRLVSKPAEKSGAPAKLFWVWNTKGKLYVAEI